MPDVLAPNLQVVFCGINPGCVSAAAGAHFANPKNDFWRLLQAASFTPRLLSPAEQFEALRFGIGITNAAYRTTRGSGDLRSADFSGALARLERIAFELRPRALAFVGKEAYRGVFGRRPVLGRQRHLLADTILFVLPSTSPANAAVPYAERLRWFRALNDELPEPEPRRAARALVLDASGRVLLVRYVGPEGGEWWVLPGGGMDPGETAERTVVREVEEETGIRVELGPLIWTREFVVPWGERWIRQGEQIYLVEIDRPVLAPLTDALRSEGVRERRWWTLDELDASDEHFAPRRLPELLRELLAQGPPEIPTDVGA